MPGGRYWRIELKPGRKGKLGDDEGTTNPSQQHTIEKVVIPGRQNDSMLLLNISVKEVQQRRHISRISGLL